MRGEGLGRRQGVCVLTCAAGARRPPTARAKLDHHPKQQLDVSLADPVSGAMAQRERRRRARSQVHALVALSQLSDAIERAPCPGRGEPGASSTGPLPIAGRHRGKVAGTELARSDGLLISVEDDQDLLHSPLHLKRVKVEKGIPTGGPWTWFSKLHKVEGLLG